MRKMTLSAAAVLGLIMVGCGSQAGTTVMTQGYNADPVMGNAPKTGTYKLYTAFSPNPTTTVKLNAGDPLGFKKTPDGLMVGVAGDQTQELPKGTSQAIWKMEN